MSALDLEGMKQNAVYAVLFMLSLVPLTFFRAFVISTLWGWFVVPLGLPAIGIALAAGLSILMFLLTVPTKISKFSDQNDVDFAKYLKNLWVTPTSALLMGFLFSFFV